MAKKESPDDAIGKLEQELRRGLIVLAALSQLKEPQYGYSLRMTLAVGGMNVEEGTLYPLLRRLEDQGFLTSEWVVEDGPPRRYYRLNSAGKKLLTRLESNWQSLVGVMNAFTGVETPKGRRAAS